MLVAIDPSSPPNQERKTPVARLRVHDRLARLFGVEAISCLGILAPGSLAIGTVHINTAC
jgi:hypothetical protein